MTDYEIIIIGGGAAGLTAGIYASRAGLKTVLLEKAIPGGLAASTDWIENYPGFPDGLHGMELMKKITQQAQKFGVEIVQFREVKSVKPVEKKIKMQTNKGTYNASALIIASGNVHKSLNVPGEEKFQGRGVSYCATCDGPLFKDKDVVVVGCGNSGLQEGEFLVKFATSVTFVEFLPYMTAEKILQERLKKAESVKFLLNHTVIRINGDNKVDSVTVKSRQTDEEKSIRASGVFIYVGLLPNSDFVKGVVELDKLGCILTNERMETSVPGIFAAGDVRSKQVRQLSTAVGEGTIAALSAQQYVEKLAEAR